MIRITTLLWVALLVVAGGTVMHVSYQVRRVQMHLAELARSTHEQKDAIRILDAEWDSLNDPHRIDDLSKRYLTLQPTPIQRVVSLEAIPLKPSQGQLDQMNAAIQKAAAGKKANPPARVPQPVPSRPSVIAAAPRAAPPAAIDGVGLILARAEKHE
jgi:cell division protein FtsL